MDATLWIIVGVLVFLAISEVAAAMLRKDDVRKK